MKYRGRGEQEAKEDVADVFSSVDETGEKKTKGRQQHSSQVCVQPPAHTCMPTHIYVAPACRRGRVRAGLHTGVAGGAAGVPQVARGGQNSWNRTDSACRTVLARCVWSRTVQQASQGFADCHLPCVPSTTTPHTTHTYPPPPAPHPHPTLPPTPQVAIPVSAINIGPVHKKDVMRANVMIERGVKKFGVILAFDVPGGWHFGGGGRGGSGGFNLIFQGGKEVWGHSRIWRESICQ